MLSTGRDAGEEIGHSCLLESMFSDERISKLPGYALATEAVVRRRSRKGDNAGPGCGGTSLSGENKLGHAVNEESVAC